MDGRIDWPKLDWAAWRETAQHLHLMTQVAGKIRLAQTPWLNHSWHVVLFPTARGMTTGPIPVQGKTLQLDFDLVSSHLTLATGDAIEQIELAPGSMADFYAAVMAALDRLGTRVDIVTQPSEMPDALPFPEDSAQRPYDPDAVRRFHRALLSVVRVFQQFRTGFLGKASAVHFFWGSFDLAVTRFSGRSAPRHPGGFPGLPDDVTCEAYSHEEASAGFWPGTDAFPKPAFYAYAYPAPAGYGAAAVPAPAYFESNMGEFILDYDAVRAAPDPEAMLLEFLHASYAAAADLAGWDRATLECSPGVPRRPRKV
ncbi:hypothetical protein IAG41_19870 [Sphingomonas sp. JC676]|uniref:DUF5996 family protein n=1 Tax=Sphingomonas sp. JC676 TaxID=2768065 RepID=UPI001657C127|nr:DUF5996 family protein [Sphingomonas sp. JC676]MBC9034653.1 hypothetical protein [Sphingomonas sp. JC676]